MKVVFDPPRSKHKNMRLSVSFAFNNTYGVGRTLGNFVRDQIPFKFFCLMAGWRQEQAMRLAKKNFKCGKAKTQNSSIFGKNGK